jgi:beta-glucosidase
VTDESIVLLKNEHDTLPLDAAAARSIAVIGPWADTVALDWYSGTPPFTVTPLAGIRSRAAKAAVSFNDGTDRAAAAALAARSQVAIVIIGNHPTCDAGWNVCVSPGEGKEAIDRKSLTLEDEALAKDVLAANPHTIVVLQTSFPYATVWTEEHAPAVLEMTHNSEEQGTALADVLFGEYNPAGRLTQTWPASLDQLPPMMDYDLGHGRTYLYSTAKPLYAFGYGLSYTTFSYSQMTITQKNGGLHIQLTVTNTGHRDGDEVVQIYAMHVDSKVSRPLEQLVAFQRVRVLKGQSRQITAEVPLMRLAYWDEAAKSFVVEHDHVEIRAGASSDDIRLRQTVTIDAGDSNEKKVGMAHAGNE